jgi:hypothetical protein
MIVANQKGQTTVSWQARLINQPTNSLIIYFAFAAVSTALAAVSTVIAFAVSTVATAVSFLTSVEAPPQAANAAIAKIANTFFIWISFND